MNAKLAEGLRAAYRRLAAFLKPQLREGSTVRGLLRVVAPGLYAAGTLDEYGLVVGMFVLGAVAALIPDELPW